MEAEDSLLSPEIRKAKEEIEYCYRLLKDDYIKQNFYEGGKPKKGVIIDKAFPFWISTDNSLYGYTSAKEMVAELSNPDFVEHIKDFDKRHKDASIFDKLVDAILKFLGIRPSYTSLERTLKNAVFTMITHPDSDLLTRSSIERRVLKDNLKQLNRYNDNIVHVNVYPKLEKDLEAQEENIEVTFYADAIDIPERSRGALTKPQDNTIIVFQNNGGKGLALLMKPAIVDVKNKTVTLKCKALDRNYLQTHSLVINVNSNNVAFIEAVEPLYTSSNALQEQQAIKIADKTAAFGVEILPNLKANYVQWLKDNPNGIIAYRINYRTFNTPENVAQNIIGNPFDWQKYGEKESLQKFYDWLTTGNNFGEPLANEAYR